MPAYLLSISGPLTTIGSFVFRARASSLAMSVLPHPGGPWRSSPFTCVNPMYTCKASQEGSILFSSLQRMFTAQHSTAQHSTAQQ